MSELAESLEALATLLEAPRKSRLKRALLVLAFSDFTAKGKPINPTAINVGDDLYLQRMSEPGAGYLRAAGPRDQSASSAGVHSAINGAPGRLYGKALEALDAGLTGVIAVGLYEKLWVTDGDPCPICDENALAGWIPADDVFPSGDEEPDAHPNCKCSLDMRREE